MLYKPLNHDNNDVSMILFYLSFMPLFYLSVQRQFDNDDVRLMDILIPFVTGLIFAVPVILLYWAMDVYFGLKWNPAGLYFYTFFNKEGFLYFPLLALLFFRYRKEDGNGLYLRELMGLFCGYFFMIAFIETLNGTVLTGYDLILMPLIRFITMAAAALLFNRFMRAAGNIRYHLAAALLILPFILNFLPLLHLLNWILVFYLLFVPAFLATIFFCYLEMRGKLPG